MSDFVIILPNFECVRPSVFLFGRPISLNLYYILLSFQDEWLIGLEIGGCISVIMLNLLFPNILVVGDVVCLDPILQVTSKPQ